MCLDGAHRVLIRSGAPTVQRERDDDTLVNSETVHVGEEVRVRVRTLPLGGQHLYLPREFIRVVSPDVRMCVYESHILIDCIVDIQSPDGAVRSLRRVVCRVGERSPAQMPTLRQLARIRARKRDDGVARVASHSERHKS